MTRSASDSTVIALDVMGGDHAPASVLCGAEEVLRNDPHVHFLLYGDESLIASALNAQPLLSQASTVYPTIDVIPGDMKPTVALRKGKKSSMGLAINAVKDAKADAIVSAGNTGALMAMSMLSLRMLPGIDRPALCSLFPSRQGKIVMLDLGANINCSSDNLFQFAVMGDAFAKTVLSIDSPRIALLNIGSEEVKGNDTIKATYTALKETSLPLNFCGYIEGDSFIEGDVDVVVSDGFSGNIALKTAEGTAKLCKDIIAKAFRSSLGGRLGALIARRALKRMFKAMDPRLYNGGVFLGLQGVVVKSHGGVDAVGYANAIRFAIDIVRTGTNDEIIEELSQSRE